jgi:hypothetical protein
MGTGVCKHENDQSFLENFSGYDRTEHYRTYNYVNPGKDLLLGFAKEKRD